VDRRSGNERQLPAHHCDEDVEPAELGGGAFHEVVDDTGRSHVSAVTESRDTGCGRFCRCLVCTLPIDIRDGDRATGSGEPSSDCAPDPASPAADDERLLPLEHVRERGAARFTHAAIV
jgi:hypothetical protein